MDQKDSLQLLLFAALHLRSRSSVRMRGHPGRFVLAMRGSRMDMRVFVYDTDYANYVCAAMLRSDYSLVSCQEQDSEAVRRQKLL
jgi:hypothetical protein